MMKRDCVDVINEKLSPLERLIGKDNLEDVQKRIADLIVASVSDDIRVYQKKNYVFFPPDYIKGIAEEAFYEVEKKIKKMYKDAMLDVAERSVQKYKELVITDLVKESGEHD